MPDETRKLQNDPPEGSRKVVEHELDRQAGKTAGGGAKDAQPKAGDHGGGNQRSGRESRN